MLITDASDKLYRHIAHVLIAIMGVIVLLTFRRYGVSWDEDIQNKYGQAVYDYYASGFHDQHYNQIFNLHLYGGMFDGFATIVDRFTPYHIFETRHLLNALVGLLGLWGTWRLGRLIGGGFVGLVSMILLGLTPMYYGHMFNNPKDVPFACGVVWSLYYMGKSLAAYPNIKPSLLLKLGIVYGLTLGVRVNGIMFLPLWGLMLAIIAYRRSGFFQWRAVWNETRRLMAYGTIVFLISYIVMLFCWPWAQENPFLNPIKAVTTFSDFPQFVEVLLDGVQYESTSLPWTYLPVYFYVQLPVLQLFLAIAGLFLWPKIYARLSSDRKRATMALVGLCVIVPTGYAVLGHPALYDAVRHFIFVLPALSILGALTTRKIVRLVTVRAAQISCPQAKKAFLAGVGVVTLALFALPLQAMIRLHPYEYIYINELDGGVQKGFGQYELDYWGSSFKEAAERLNAYVNAEGGVPAGRTYKVAICGPWASAMTYLPKSFKAVEGSEPADFYLATTRWRCEDMREGKIVATIARMGAPLSVVKDIRGTDEGNLGSVDYRKGVRYQN